MVSHIDDDHIHGLLDLTGELIDADSQGQTPNVTVGSFWHNSFNDLTDDQGELFALLQPSDAERLSNSSATPAASAALPRSSRASTKGASSAMQSKRSAGD